MQGWKTWAGVGLVMLGGALHVFDMEYLAETAYAAGASMVAVGLGHKIEKLLRGIASGASAAADQLAKLPAEDKKV